MPSVVATSVPFHIVFHAGIDIGAKTLKKVLITYADNNGLVQPVKLQGLIIAFSVPAQHIWTLRILWSQNEGSSWTIGILRLV